MKIAAKFTGFSFALFAILLLSSATSAQEGKGKGGGQKGKGSARQRGGEKGPQRGGRAAQNPVKMVEEMIARFDKDGDKKLDAKELVAMFTEMRQSRGARGGAGAAVRGRGAAVAQQMQQIKDQVTFHHDLEVARQMQQMRPSASGSRPQQEQAIRAEEGVPPPAAVGSVTR